MIKELTFYDKIIFIIPLLQSIYGNIFESERMVNPMTISSITTSKGDLRYAECCSGPRILIMLPGVSVTSVLDSAAAVEKAYQSFDGKYTIYLFEYPREYPDGEGITYIADILAEAIHMLNLKNCYLLGASFGGMVGQVLLAEHPELFVSAVLASTIAQLTEVSPKTISRWNTIASNKDVRTLNLAFYDAVYSDEYQIKFAEPIRKILENGNEKDCLIMAIHTEMILQADLRSYDKKIKTPTLVVGATNDHVFSYKDVSEVANLIGCKSFFYDGSSHAVFDEEQDFKQRVLEHYDTSVDYIYLYP